MKFESTEQLKNDLIEEYQTNTFSEDEEISELEDNSDDNQTETNELDFDQVQQEDQKNDHTIEETPIQTSQDNLAKSSDEDKTQDL